MTRSERFWFWLAWHLPRRLVALCAVRVWAEGTTGPYGETNATTVTVDEVLRRWDGQSA